MNSKETEKFVEGLYDDMEEQLNETYRQKKESRDKLLKEIALMLERQDMLSKLTENVCLDEYGYSETHCIDYIGKLELPNVTKVAEHMQMTRGAISKMTKKLLAKGQFV